MIRGLNHIGISVSNLERSIEFYREMFGMQVAVERRFGEEAYDRILALKHAVGRVTLLKGHQIQIELFEFIRPQPKTRDKHRPVCDHGISHFCVEVSDIHSEYRRMCAAGAVFHSEPVNFSGSAFATYGRDPDGNVFELWQQGENGFGNIGGCEER